jgi:hypothetical protein
MDQPVGKDRHAGHGGEQGRDHRGIGLPARGEDQRRLGPLECGDPGLDREVRIAGAGHQPRSAGPGAMGPRPFAGPLGQQRVAGKAEIIVA